MQQRTCGPQRRRFPRACAALALVLAGGLGATSSFAAPDWDMVGLKLGMTEAEVKAAFTAYDPKGKIVASNSSFNYSDKVNSFRTPQFLNSLELRVVRQSGQTPLKVWFSGPEGEVRVIAIKRQEQNIPNPPTGAQFKQSLVGKYGEPTASDSAGTPTWQEGGKPSCIKTSYGLDFNPFSGVLVSNKADFAEAVAELDRRQQGVGKGLMPADLRNCGAFMYYTGTNFNPASHFVAGLFDVGAIAATHKARAAWVGKLQDEAVRKREGGAQTPRL